MNTKYKVGDIVKLKRDSGHYTGRYAGTDVIIQNLDTTHHCTVIAYDGYNFVCPYSYFDDDDLIWTAPECACGAHKVWGKNCPDYYHLDFCPLYRPKKD